MSLATDLEAFGIPKSSIRWLDAPRAPNVAYLDLVSGVALTRRGSLRVRASAVVEAQDQPILYIVETKLVSSGNLDATSEIVAKLRHKLAARGDGAYLALSEPGKLTIYTVGLDELPEPVVRKVSDASASGLFSKLSGGLLVGDDEGDLQDVTDRTVFHEKLFHLLIDVSKRLLASPGLEGQKDDVLSLVGRALFARFLIDRRFSIAGHSDDPEGCFSTPARAISTCVWMDEVFNGDLLQLAGKDYGPFFNRLGKEHVAFQLLTGLMRGTLHPQLAFPFWDDIDFSHVPVGLLSEVYERLAHQHGQKAAKAESIHYTPRNIAGFMVDQAFSGLLETERPGARCLDPACGGGVFLVLCFQRIVRELWEQSGQQPSREQLRSILETQLVGFDINDSALKLTALSLYLAAIEMDPEPAAKGSLKFKPMRDITLIHARGPDEPHPNSFVLGSLGPMIPTEHRSRYHIVIGNPAWTAWKRGDGGEKVTFLNDEATKLTRRIAAQRAEKADGDARARLLAIAQGYHNPDSVPDLAFAWRAMEWAMPGKVIVLAMHGRLLFKQSDVDPSASSALFSALRLTGLVNGAGVRKTPVWPNAKPHWCLLFALNEVPHASQAFYYVNPEWEPALNQRGRVRIDFTAAEPIEFEMLWSKPHLLKTIFRGNAFDADILQRLLKVKRPSVREYFARHALVNGDGYQLSLKTKSGSLKNSSHLIGLPNLTPKTWKGTGHKVNVSELDSFLHKEVRRPKTRAHFRAPLLIVPETPSSDRHKRGAVVLEADVVYNESYYGYSAARYKAGSKVGMLRYLHVLTYSSLFYHYTLMTSSKFGVERDSMLKEDFDLFPIVPFEELTADVQSQAKELSLAVENDTVDFAELDRWVARLYGLSDRDLDVMLDAYNIAMPFTKVKARAASRTAPRMRAEFVAEIARRLNGLLSLVGAQIVPKPDVEMSGTWVFFALGTDQVAVDGWRSGWLKALADDQGASMIVVDTPKNLVVGLLDQQRYWTRTRAAVIANEIIRKHSDQFLPRQPE